MGKAIKTVKGIKNEKNFENLFGMLALLMITVCSIPNNTADSMLSNEKELVAFGFFVSDNNSLLYDVQGIISGTDILLTVPYRTDVTALVASFTIRGEEITANGNLQMSGSTSNDFSSPVTYIVKAEDGSTKAYTVKVISEAAAIENIGFSSASIPGDSGSLKLSQTSEEIIMIYAQNKNSISFPTGTDDATAATISTQFWIAETQFTNAQAATVLQWAYDNALIEESDGIYNEVNSSEVKYGGQQLLNLDTSGASNQCRVIYSNGSFAVESGFEDHPLSDITWFGAVMMCNWLTRMRDGHDDNVVYSNIQPVWVHTDTTENTLKNGYRLPSSDEWEYAARYLGTNEPTTEPLATERYFGNDSPNWTDGYYWTPGIYASGAIADYTHTEACQAVAVYSDSEPRPETTAHVKSLGYSSANTLGLYDMSGNVYEWCFTARGTDRIGRGGRWGGGAGFLVVGYYSSINPETADDSIGFRICRTDD